MTDPRPNSPWSRAPRAALLNLLATVAAVNVITMPGDYYGGDPSAMRQEARSIALKGHLWVDPKTAASMGQKGQFYVVNVRTNRHYSKYGVMNSLMFLPPVLAEAALTSWRPPEFGDQGLLFLNAEYVALSVWLAALLYRLAGLYTDSPAARVVYVLSTLYATFLWNYLRAQTGELFQVLFFTGHIYYLVCFLRGVRSDERGVGGPRRADLAASWAFLAALCLTKVSYLLLLPAPLVAEVVCLYRVRRSMTARQAAGWAAAVAAGAVAVVVLVAWANFVKFGSPFVSGYHQWDPKNHSLSGRLLDGVIGFTLDPQHSALIHFPVLVLAAFGARDFLRRHPFESAVVALAVLPYFAAVCKLPSWRGEWCYGPRYLLFALPVLSLPFATVVARTLADYGSGLSRAGLLTGVVVLGVSFACQVQVNRHEFFAFYSIKSSVERLPSPALRRYFATVPFAVFSAQLDRVNTDPESLPYVRALRDRYPERTVNGYLAFYRAVANHRNYYWPRR